MLVKSFDGVGRVVKRQAKENILMMVDCGGLEAEILLVTLVGLA